MSLTVVILAAGQGTRMGSELPKVLHPVGGRAMLEHVVGTARELGAERIIVVYGYGGATVPQRLSHLDVEWAEQAEQRGTGHAVGRALDRIDTDGRLVVLYGDVPLVDAGTLRDLLEATPDDGLGLLTARLPDPRGYGRIVRNAAGAVERIVEQKDADEDERRIDEINTGIMVAPTRALRRWVADLGANNAQGEYYLTDAVGMAVAEGRPVRAATGSDAAALMGVNDRIQLAAAERAFQRRCAEHLMRQGVTLLDPQRFDLRGTLHVGRDVVIDVDVVIEGEVALGDGVRVGPYTLIRDTSVAPHTEIFSHCVIAGARVGGECRIGPFSRIRPETALQEGAHVGNFVEMKKADIGAGSKVNHLSYIGDTQMGSGVNIGAGTITCNYDGANKHLTVIGDGAFIGSDTQLVAPVTIGAGATIGAGSTISRDAPPGELTLSRVKQETRHGWKRPQKEDKNK